MKKNNNVFIYGIILMVLSSMCTCTGQLMWKLATNGESKLFYYLLGFILYGLGAIVMIIAFRFGELSILHPMLSVGFVLSIILGAIFVAEKISVGKILGIIFIVIGMIFLGHSAKKEEVK